MTQTLTYKNDTGATGTYIQQDVALDGVTLLQSAGDITSVVLKITWNAPYDWQHSECYVNDPDGSTHYMFTAGSLPFGSGVRTDTLTIASGSFPSSIDGVWEFYLDDQMGGSNTLDEVVIDVEVTSANMPTTYGEIIWHNADDYQGGIDVSGNARHVYPANSASIVTQTGSTGTHAFDFNGTDQFWGDDTLTSTAGTATMSVSAWFRHNGTSGIQVIACNHGSNKGQWSLYRSGTSVYFYAGYYLQFVSGGSDAELFYAGGVANSSNTWYHVCVLWDGGEASLDKVKMFIDGTQIASTISTRATYGSGLTVLPAGSVSGPHPPYTIGALQECSIGGGPTGTLLYPFAGQVDAVRSWSSVLTADDIAWVSSGRNVAGGPTSFKSYFIQNSNPVGFTNA